MKKSNFPKTLVLFDIDGTLISAGRSGYFALEKAIVEILGAPKGLEGIRLDGNTDSNAILQICKRDRVPHPFPPGAWGGCFGDPSPDKLKRFKRKYTEILKSEISDKGHIKPGVSKLLKELESRPEVTLGLVTGNFREGAEIKLMRFGLWKYFRIGAYGCEHPERSELVRLAIKRAEEKSGIRFESQSITVVGDTIYDVRSCKPWGVNCLAVGTGSASTLELQNEGATWTVQDLSETEKILNLLTNVYQSVS